MNANTSWQPRVVKHVWFSLDTSMATTRVLTDVGDGYLKALGNRQGPHLLASELVATELARWFGLPTFDAAVIVLPLGRLRLVAMDHSHCFTCGRDLTTRLADLDRERDERLYGLFPAFLPRLRRDILETCGQRLQELDAAFVRNVLATIRRAWEVSAAIQSAWQSLICRRATFVAEVIVDRLLAICS